MSKSSKLSTESYKGVRDFYPEDWAIQKYIFDVWRKTAESFGYVEYNASPLEPTELYKAKSGEEIINEQTYSFKDRGDRDVTLRPEMTPTVARMIAGKRRGLKFPQRWFSIPNLFRYERPQRGRLREHYQLNCDIFGVPGIGAEVEMITLAYNIMKNFGLKDDQFEIRIGHISFLTSLIQDHVGIDKETTVKIRRLWDKKNKISDELFLDNLKKLLNDEQQTKLAEVASKNEEDFFEIFKNNEIFLKRCELEKKLILVGIKNIVFQLNTLTRGFDYYTGFIFEIYDKNPENPRALFGGGRYDNLLEIFGEEKLPTVGFGMGDVTIRDVLETYRLLPEFKSATDLLICPISENHFEESEKLADILREKNINVSVNLTNKKVGDQVAKANIEKIPFVIVVGDDEVKNKVYKLKKLETKEEFTGNVNDVVSVIHKDK